MELLKNLEAILFVSGGPIVKSKLASLIGVGKKDIDQLIEEYKAQSDQRGIRIMIHDDTVSLVTSPETSGVIQKLISEELQSNLSKAGLEALTIVLYKGPVTRTEVNFIRGVESSVTLQTLLMRGLIERAPNPNDSRSYIYSSSRSLLKHLGISSLQDLPHYQELKKLKNDEITDAIQHHKMND
jgi:segregation and condensation protein B